MEDSSEIQEEIWKPVPIEGFESLYEVSNLGRVRSLDRVVPHTNTGQIRVKGRVLKQQKNHNGYLRVVLAKNGSKTYKYVHRLVVMAYVENPDPERYDQVNHKDEDKTNNVWTNLEWCSQSYNNNYGTHNQRAAEKKSKPVEAFDSNWVIVYRFASTMDAGRSGFNQGAVWQCCNGKLKTHKGLYWRYVDNSSEV